MNSLNDFSVVIFLPFLFSLCFINGDERLRKVYDQLGCSPIPGNSSKPEAYNCDEIFSRRRDVCYYNGHEYHVNNVLTDEDKIANPCLNFCNCQLVDRSNYKNNATYMSCGQEICTVGTIFETTPTNGCYFQYSKDECCETRTYCPDGKASVHQCVHDGKTYRDGEQIYINDYTCICSPQFKGVVDDQNCRKRRCDFDGGVFYVYMLEKGAAVFTDFPTKSLTISECPFGWYHPKYQKGHLIEIDSSESSNSPHKCQYGKLELSVGQKIHIEDNSMFNEFKRSCSCNIPPIVNCYIRRKNDKQ